MEPMEIRDPDADQVAILATAAAEAADAQDEAAVAEPPVADPADPEPQPEVAAVETAPEVQSPADVSTAQLDALKAQLGELRSQMLLSQAQQNQQQAPPPEPEPQPLTVDEIEAMSRSEFAQYNNEQMVATIKAQFGPEFDALKVTVDQMRARTEINETAAKHEDFWTHQDAMQQLTTANPLMTVEQAYTLAKAAVPQPSAATAPAAASVAPQPRQQAATTEHPSSSAPTRQRVPQTPAEANKQAWKDSGMDGAQT